MTASTTVMAHPGHEAFGDALHLEYLFVAAAAVAIGIYGLIRHKRDGKG